MSDPSSTPPARPPRRPASPAVRAWARWMFQLHLWVGVAITFLVVAISVTGILLNHKRALGFMPGTDEERSEAFAGALSLPVLVERAAAAVDASVAEAGVDRMDVRPGDGIVKVRFDDAEVTEVTVALDDGEVLAIGLRNDVFLEKLHSGEIFGDGWILLSDAAAIALVLLLLSGLWMWLYPRVRAA